MFNVVICMYFSVFLRMIFYMDNQQFKPAE